MSRSGAWRRALAVGGAVVALDQVAKLAVTESLASGERVDLVLGFHLTRLSNEGVAFGVLGDGGAVVLAVTIAALAGVLAWFALNPGRRLLWLGAGLVTGGAVGNLIDRLRTEGVTDFVDPPFWPAFNVADIAITAGAIVLVLASFEAERGGVAAGGGP